MRILLATVLALLSLAAVAPGARAGVCEQQPTREARQDGGYELVIRCSGGAGPIVVTGSEPSAEGTVTPLDDPSDGDARFAYRPQGAAEGPGWVEWTYDGATYRQDFTISATGNNPPECEPPAAITVGTNERAQGTVRCVDRDLTGETRDALALVFADPPHGRLEGQTAQPDGVSVSFTYVLDGASTATADAVAFTARDNYAANPKETSGSVAVQIPGNTAPTCPAVAARTPAGQPVAVAISCSDPDAGDAIALRLTGAPSGGTVAATSSGFTYTPRSGFSGTDSFTVEASDGRSTVSIAVSITVVAPDADGDGSPAGIDCDDNDPLRAPGRPEILGNSRDEDCANGAQSFVKLSALVAPKWRVLPLATVMRSLVIRNLPAGSRVELRCRGRFCPFKTVRYRPRGKRLDVTKRLNRSALLPGAKLEVRVTAPDRIGKVVRFKMRSKRKPSVTVLCLAPGSSRAKRCV